MRSATKYLYLTPDGTEYREVYSPDNVPFGLINYDSSQGTIESRFNITDTLISRLNSQTGILGTQINSLSSRTDSLGTQINSLSSQINSLSTRSISFQNIEYNNNNSTWSSLISKIATIGTLMQLTFVMDQTSPSRIYCSAFGIITARDTSTNTISMQGIVRLIQPDSGSTIDVTASAFALSYSVNQYTLTLSNSILNSSSGMTTLTETGSTITLVNYSKFY